MKRAGILSCDAPVPTDEGDRGADCFSWGRLGEEAIEPEMDCFTFESGRMDGDNGEDAIGFTEGNIGISAKDASAFFGDCGVGDRGGVLLGGGGTGTDAGEGTTWSV